MKLVLGVVDIPYTAPSAPKKVTKAQAGKANKPRKIKRSSGSVPSITTGEVAILLEKHYHIMRVFAESNENFIKQELIKSMQATIVNLKMGGPVNRVVPYEEAFEAIRLKFNHFLDTQVMESLGIPGVPTRAALDGVQTRLKLMHGPRRASFIDTGQYEASMRVWSS